MEKPRLYDVSKANSSLESELERLYNQANFSARKEIRALQELGLRDGMSVLEVASGPGFVTEWLSGVVSSGSITCVEIDRGLIEYAEQYLKDKAQSRYSIVEGNIMKLDFPDNTFDFAFARLIFIHLEDQVGAAKEIMRVLKPGGKLVVSETDFFLNHLTDPYLPEFQPIRDKLLKYQLSIGANAMMGRSLWRILKKAGFEQIDLEAVICHSGEKGMEWFYPQINPDRIAPLVKEGVITEEEDRLFRASVDKFVNLEDPFYMRIIIMAGGTKPENNL